MATATLSPVPVRPTPSPTTTTASSTATAPPAGGAVTLRSPVGRCREDATQMYPPTDPESLCESDWLILGHALPGGRGYLGRLVPTLRVGQTLTYQGHRYRVTQIVHAGKDSLPAWVWQPTADRLIITCDPSSGYTSKWGGSHALGNVVVRLTLA